MKRWPVIVALLPLLSAGCGKSGPQTVEVSGTIKLNGKPTEGLDVVFISDGFTSFGRTDSEGRYKLAKGAVPGTEYKVCISNEKTQESEEDIEAGLDAGQEEAAAVGTGRTVRKKRTGPVIGPQYSDPKKTKLTYSVPDSGTDSANFDITISK